MFEIDKANHFPTTAADERMKTDVTCEGKLKDFAEDLLEKVKRYAGYVPVKREAQNFIDDFLRFLFPQYSEKRYYATEEIGAKLVIVKRNLKNILYSLAGGLGKEIDAEEATERFVQKIPDIYDALQLDAEAIYQGDPAAESVDEVILAYPGFFAIAVYRVAHEFYEMNVPIFPRMLTEYAHQVTGVDIHPGARVGKSFSIDHGTGVVIGETTVIGDRVKIYQGVTLGGLSVKKKLAKTKRHPTIENDVVIYSQAVILGGETTIGANSVVGGNAWLTESVPPNSVVYHKSKVAVRNANEKDEPINFSI
jgi:serine O-acetyltransferase